MMLLDAFLLALRALARKYGVVPDALPALREEFSAKQDALSEGGGRIKQAETAVVAARVHKAMEAKQTPPTCCSSVLAR